MAITVEELDLWVKSNWTKKFDKQTGLGDPTTLGVIGLGVFDVFENLLTGDMYVWSLELSQYSGSPNFKGFVKSDADVTALLPLALNEFVVVYEAFSLNSTIPKKVGDIITATSLVSTLASMVTNTVTTASPPTWGKVEQNLGGIGVSVVRLDASRRVVIENSGAQTVTSVDSIYDVIGKTLNVGTTGAQYSAITTALLAASTGNLISVFPGTYTGNLTYNKDTVVIAGEDSLSNQETLTVIDGTVSTAAGGTRLRCANISITGAVTLSHGASHKFFNVNFNSAVTISALTGIVEFTNCKFGADVTIQVSSTANVYFYDCKFAGVVTNNSTVAVVLKDTVTIPSSLSGNKTIIGQYGTSFYSESTYADTIANTSGYKMLIIGADGKVQSATISTGGGGGGTYTNPTPVPVTIGGIAAGTTFDNVALTDMFTQLLYPYQAPAFTSFSVAGLVDTEVGNTFAAQNRNASWATSNSSNINANTISIIDVSNGNAVLASGLPNTSPASVAFPLLQMTTAGSKQFRISATNTQSTSFNRLLTINWQWAVYYGESPLTTLASGDVAALRVKNVTSTANGSYIMQPGNYKYIAYPVSFGLKSTFKDQATNLDVAMVAASTVSVTNIHGISTNYYVHRTLNQLGGSITIIVS